jgi:hypothetical protein
MGGALETIDIQDVPRETPTGPSANALITRINTRTAFQKAEVEKRKAEKEEAKKIAADTEKERRADQDTKGLRESIESRRAQARETLEGTKTDDKAALEKAQDAYIKEMDALDEEEEALKVVEKARKKVELAKKKPSSEPLPVAEVKELPPGVLDEKRPKSGKPYKSQASAENIKKITPKYKDYEVVEVEGGFVLQDRGNTPLPAVPTAGIEVEELKKVPGPKPKVGKAPKRVPGGSQLRDALKGAGVTDEIQQKIDEDFPYFRRQAGDVISDAELKEFMPSKEEFIQNLLDGKIPKALQRQAGDTDETAAKEPEPFVGPPREVPAFLERKVGDLFPPKNGLPDGPIETGPSGGGPTGPTGGAPIETGPTGGTPAETSPYDKNPEDWTEDDIGALIDEATGEAPVETGPTEPVVDKAKLEADRRKRRAIIHAKIRAEGLNTQTDEGKARIAQLREEQGLDEDFNPIPEPETTEPTVETGPTGPAETTGFTPSEPEDDLTALGVEDDALEGIDITYEFEGDDVGEGTVTAPARSLLALSRKRIKILNQLGACVSK